MAFQMVLSNPRVQLANGFKKLKTNRAKVSVNGEVGNYFVVGNENRYNVRLWKNSQGLKLAECCCQANQNGMFCYHIAAAFLAHVGIMRQRKQIIH